MFLRSFKMWPAYRTVKNTVSTVVYVHNLVFTKFITVLITEKFRELNYWLTDNRYNNNINYDNNDNNSDNNNNNNDNNN